MSVKSIRQALEVALNTWASANSVSVAWQNVKFSPSSGTKYVRVSILPADTQNPSMGDDHKRYIGLMQVLIYGDDAVGSSANETLVDSLFTSFARGLSLSAGGVSVRILDSPSVSPSFDDGGWYVTPVTIRYQADVF